MNQENLLFEIQKQQAFNDPRDFLLFSKANTHNSVGVQLYREFSILPLLKAKKEFFDFYYDFNDDIKKIVFYTGSNTADLGQEFFILTESKVSKDTIDRAQKLSQLADLKGYIEHYVANILKEDSIEMQNT